MADLKTTIAQTENLKNKVKLAKDRINETVVRGGGITSKSLSEIPDNINKMLEQYKKIAILYPNLDINIRNSNINDYNININSTFAFSKFFMIMDIKEAIVGNTKNAILGNENKWIEGNLENTYGTHNIHIGVREYTNANIKITVMASSGYATDIKIKEIILME